MDEQQAAIIKRLQDELGKTELTRQELQRELQLAYAAPWEYLEEGFQMLPDLYLEVGSYVLRDSDNRIRAAIDQGGGSYWTVIMFDENGKDTYSWEHDITMGYDEDDFTYESAKEKVMELFTRDGVKL